MRKGNFVAVELLAEPVNLVRLSAEHVWAGWGWLGWVLLGVVLIEIVVLRRPPAKIVSTKLRLLAFCSEHVGQIFIALGKALERLADDCDARRP